MPVEVHDREEWLARRAAEKAEAREEQRRRWREEHDAELERRRQARQAAREQRKASYEQARAEAHADTDTRFEEEMATSLNISVDEFRQLQAQRRAEIEGQPAISYSPDHQVH